MLTAGDIVNRLIDFSGGQQGGDLLLSKCRRAMQDAVRDFPTMHRWNWYNTLGRVDLKKSQTDGTIEFDAVTRIVTLTGATWPSWALNAMLRCGQVVTRVISVTDPTHLVLDPSYTFQASLVPGTPYRLFLDCYALPSNFAASDMPVRESWWGGLRYIPPSKWLWGIRGYDSTGTPTTFTIQPLQAGGIIRPGGGQFAMFVTPNPNEDSTLDFMYRRLMRPVVYDVGINKGTLTTSADGMVCTFDGADPFVPAMVGSVIRITNSKLSPELKGVVIHETTIGAVPNSNSVVLVNACPLIGTATLGYTVSDPIDIDSQSMSTAFQWMALRTIAVESMSKAAGGIAAAFQAAYDTARAADARYAGPDRLGPRQGGGGSLWEGPVTTET